MTLNGFVKFQRSRFCSIFWCTCFFFLCSVSKNHLLFMLFVLLQGANFRDLPGLLVDDKRKRVRFDPSVKRARVKSGKFLV